ncbi:MAG TPA: glycosyltransferase [Verrucomicrobiae bacterium]|nr:glycosyltransferase [Verrucomicrobiae bacterium]
MNDVTVAYIFEFYPAISQTFLKREITELMRQGLRVEVYSLWRVGLDTAPSAPGASLFPEFDELTIHCFRWWEPFRLLVALPRELRRDPTLLRDAWRMLRRYRPVEFGNCVVNLWGAVFAICRAREFRRRRPDVVHGVWATGAATAAAILSRLCDIPYSVGTDGYDVYEHGGDQFLEPKLRGANFVQANFQANADYLRQRVPEARVVLARRGLDHLPSIADRPRPSGPIRILSVGRLVPKKGHCYQLDACALLKRWGVAFEARIIGDGKLRRDLQSQVRMLGLADAVTLCGARPHDEVQQAYRWADIFWHTGIIDKHGNRDGLPNVIPEAMAHQLPVICGPVAGAIEPVKNDVTGLVVDVADRATLAGAVKRLADDQSLRRRLGANGRRWVEGNFLVNKNVAVLADAFRTAASRHESKPTVAYILMKYPSFSQTFLQREIAELIRQGLSIEVHSLWRVASFDETVAAGFGLRVRYFRWWNAFNLLFALPRELWRDPVLLRDGWRVWRCSGAPDENTSPSVGRLCESAIPSNIAPPRRGGLQGSAATTTDFLKNLWAVIFAVCRAKQFRQSRIRMVHGAWAASPATAAAILGRLRGVPFSFGAHAYDIYEHGGDQFLDAKLRAASFVHTTTHANVEYLRERVTESKIVLARRGLDRLPEMTNKVRKAGPIRILSVGRLTAIKSHHHQLAACAQLKHWGVPFEARIIGGGELRRDLQSQIRMLGLADAVTLCGARPHDEVQQAYHWADIFWHTGIIDENGNRDGLPNVIPEAFAHQLPVICGPLPGATEAVTHELSGLVVDVANPVALAGAVKRLANDELLRRRLGKNGRRWVEENFVVNKNAAVLADAFRRTMRVLPSEQPLISFIIPVFNCLDLTRDCLKSLEQTVHGYPWEAIIVDDCSTDGTAEFLARLSAPYRILRNKTKQSYSASNNRAAALARGEFLCFLNNDTVLTPGWLEPMLAVFQNHPDAGVVGNVQRNPRNGRYDHMGFVFSPGGLHKSFGKYFFFKPLTGCVKWRAVTAACCLVRKAVFQEVDGFDESFVHGCEDIDLCLRLGQAGLKHYVAADSVIYHYVSSSETRRDLGEKNRQILLERWAAFVRRNLTLRDHLLYFGNAILRLMCWPGA